MNFRTNLGFSLLTSSVLVFALAGISEGQAVPPLPSPTPDETPVVISRDETESDTALPETTDVRESTDVAAARSVTSLPDIPSPSAAPSGYNISLSDAQQKMMLYLDFLAKTEARAENLRTKLFEMIEKENSVKLQIQRVEYNLSPERMQNSAALIGSLRPEDVRDERQKMLQSERNNLQSLLSQVELSRVRLETALTSADRLVERVRARFERYVDKALEAEFEEL